VIGDWLDVALAPLSHADRKRVLAQLRLTTEALTRGLLSWTEASNRCAQWSARATVEGDAAASWFWAYAAREFSDREEIAQLTTPRASR
jgi:hypothetical protein